MDQSPKVSVIMTAFNEERFIGNAIQSIIDQTFGNWELLIVDDGSQDRTARIAAEYAEKDPRIRLIRNLHEGRAQALNTGLQAAQGKYIAILDADDYAFPHRLQKSVNYLDEHDDVVVVGSFALYRDLVSRQEWLGRVPVEDAAIRRQMLVKMAFNHPSLMFKKTAVKGLSYINKNYFEDYLFCAALLSRGKGANIPEPLVIINRHPGSITQPEDRSQNYRKSLKTQYLVLRTLQARLPAYLLLLRPILGWIKYQLLRLVSGGRET